MPEEVVLTPEQVATAEATAASQKAEQDRVSAEAATKPAEEQKKSEGTEEVVEFDTKQLTKDGDGNLVLVVDPENPKSTVYKGRDLDEILSNIAKGIKEKDSYIAKQKASKVTAADFKTETLKQDPQRFPEFDEIAEQVQKQYLKAGVTAEMFSWTDKQWRDYELDNGGLLAMRKLQAVERANNEIQQRYATVNVAQINVSIIDDETEAVQELLAEYELDPDDDGFDFTEVLNRVYSDDKNKRANGMLKNGRIVREAEREIRRISQAKLKTDTRRDADEAIAKARADKEKAGTVESSTRTKPDASAKKAPSTTEEALQQALAELTAGAKK